MLAYATLALSFAFLVDSFKFSILTKRIENLEEKTIFSRKKLDEIEVNHKLLSHHVENIFKDEIFVSRDEFLEALQTITEDFEKSEKDLQKVSENSAFEIEEMRKFFEKITRSQAKRIDQLDQPFVASKDWEKFVNLKR